MPDNTQPEIKQPDSTLPQYDIQIAEDGRWFHEGGEIKRLELVKLFASVLSYEQGHYWLRTPAEEGVITVDDAPFIIISCSVSGEGQSQNIEFQDNLGRCWQLGAAYPLRVRAGKMKDEPRPYLHLDKGLTARISRPVFYELANLAVIDDAERGNAEMDIVGKAGIWSAGSWFSLETEDDAS